MVLYQALLILVQIIISKCFILPSDENEMTCNWFEAESHCLTTYNSHLISIHDAITLTQIKNAISNISDKNNSHNYWIGLSNANASLFYVWSDDTKFNFGIDLLYISNNSGNNTESITLKLNNDTLLWQNANVQSKYYWICNDPPIHTTQSESESESDTSTHITLFHIGQLLAIWLFICCFIISFFIMILTVYFRRKKKSKIKRIRYPKSIKRINTKIQIANANANVKGDEIPSNSPISDASIGSPNSIRSYNDRNQTFDSLQTFTAHMRQNAHIIHNAQVKSLAPPATPAAPAVQLQTSIPPTPPAVSSPKTVPSPPPSPSISIKICATPNFPNFMNSYTSKIDLTEECKTDEYEVENKSFEEDEETTQYGNINTDGFMTNDTDQYKQHDPLDLGNNEFIVRKQTASQFSLKFERSCSIVTHTTNV